MKDHMARLAAIVKIDQEIQALKEELEETPSKVREIQNQLQGITGAFQEKKTEKDKVEAEIKKYKSEVEDETTLVKSREERLNATKTQKEYQAVLKEIATGKTMIKEREASIARLSAALEELTKVVEPLQGQSDELLPQLETAQAEIQGTVDQLADKLKNLESQFNEQLSSLPEDIIHKYRRIQDKKQPAAARLLDGTCQECYISIPPQLFLEIRKTQEINSCPNCHRLLYIDFND